MARKAKPLETLGRGVWVAPWVGPDEEMVLLAITADGKLATEVPTVVPNGASRLDASDRLWEVIETTDPDRRSMMRVI